MSLHYLPAELILLILSKADNNKTLLSILSCDKYLRSFKSAAAMPGTTTIKKYLEARDKGFKFDKIIQKQNDPADADFYSNIKLMYCSSSELVYRNLKHLTQLQTLSFNQDNIDINRLPTSLRKLYIGYTLPVIVTADLSRFTNLIDFSCCGLLRNIINAPPSLKILSTSKYKMVKFSAENNVEALHISNTTDHYPSKLLKLHINYCYPQLTYLPDNLQFLHVEQLIPINIIPKSVTDLTIRGCSESDHKNLYNLPNLKKLHILGRSVPFKFIPNTVTDLSIDINPQWRTDYHNLDISILPDTITKLSTYTDIKPTKLPASLTELSLAYYGKEIFPIELLCCNIKKFKITIYNTFENYEIYVAAITKHITVGSLTLFDDRCVISSM